MFYNSRDNFIKMKCFCCRKSSMIKEFEKNYEQEIEMNSCLL